MIRGCKEESFHQRQGVEAMTVLADGTPGAADDDVGRSGTSVVAALTMFGPSDTDSPNSAQAIAWGFKPFSNHELRRRFVDATEPQAEHLGLTVPDPDLSWDGEHYRSGEIDWTEFCTVTSRDGPCNRERLARRVQARDDGAWVREAPEAYAGRQLRQAA